MTQIHSDETVMCDILNIAQLFENPFTNKFDHKLYSKNDLYMEKEKVIELSSEKGELMFSIDNAYELIKKELIQG